MTRKELTTQLSELTNEELKQKNNNLQKIASQSIPKEDRERFFKFYQWKHSDRKSELIDKLIDGALFIKRYAN